MSDAMFVKSYRASSAGEMAGTVKFPRKSSRWDLFLEPVCVTSTKCAQVPITFTLGENNGPINSEIVYITVDFFHLRQVWANPDLLIEIKLLSFVRLISR
jgi:hypothetical protein